MKKIFFLMATMCCTLMIQAKSTSETLTCDGSTKTAETEHFSLVATAKDGVDSDGWTHYAYQNDQITITAKDGETKMTQFKVTYDDRSNNAPSSGYVVCTPGTTQAYTWNSYYQMFTDINATSAVISITGAGCHVQSVEVFFEEEDVTTALDNAADQAKSVKMIENGQVVILRDGKKFNLVGAKL